MSYSVEFSEYAIKTFADIKAQVDIRWGHAVVLEFEQRTEKVLAIIRSSPFIYKAVYLNSNVRKAPIHKNCSMFYEIKDNYISISFFWDNRQDPIFL